MPTGKGIEGMIAASNVAKLSAWNVTPASGPLVSCNSNKTEKLTSYIEPTWVTVPVVVVLYRS